MKKIWVFLLCAAMLITLPTTAFAHDGYNTASACIEEKPEIEDIATLYARAKEGVSDIPLEEINRMIGNSVAVLKDGHGRIREYDIHVTAQVLKREAISDQPVSIAITSIMNLPDIAGEGNQEISAPDQGLGLTAYSTIYYDIQPNYRNGYDGIRLKKVSGGWQVYDSSYKLSNRSVSYGQWGNDANGVPRNETGGQNISSNSFQYNTGFVYYVTDDGSLLGFNAKSYVTITRGSSSWQMELYNKY